MFFQKATQHHQVAPDKMRRQPQVQSDFSSSARVGRYPGAPRAIYFFSQRHRSRQTYSTQRFLLLETRCAFEVDAGENQSRLASQRQESPQAALVIRGGEGGAGEQGLRRADSCKRRKAAVGHNDFSSSFDTALDPNVSTLERSRSRLTDTFIQTGRVERRRSWPSRRQLQRARLHAKVAIENLQQCARNDFRVRESVFIRKRTGGVPRNQAFCELSL